ncbi:MAG: anthranilate phosphoribosyltransferase [Actinomycetales bacterium]|nr:anthranilate phosphoribosyltransferase [Actinomycetales bacterium]
MSLIPDTPTDTWPGIYARLLSRGHLSRQDCAWAMGTIMDGEATAAQIAGFLMALHAKGETVEEMRGLADEMLAHAIRIDAPEASLDVVGTGGDRAHTVNISTMAAIVCAAAGVSIVKHGNRAASSKAGSADVLESLGIDLTLSPERVEAVARDVGITFCFAQQFHPSMRHAAGVRRELGVATAFNFLGPLTNPGQPKYGAVGVADARMAPIIAGVFAGRGQDAAVFRGDDGLDELTLSTTSTVWWVRSGEVIEHTLDPDRVGLAAAPTEALRGGDAAFNARVLREVFEGARGPVRDAVLLNAGAALAVAADSDSGRTHAALHADVRAGMDRAEAAIDSGAANSVVDRWVAATRT